MTDKSIWQTIDGNYHYTDTPILNFIYGFIYKNCNSIFEAGCGSGSLPNNLRKKGWQGRYLGSDYTEAFLEMAQKNLPNERFRLTNLLEPIMSNDNAFDCAIALDTFDCVYPYEIGFRELRRISKKYVIITLWQGFLNDNTIKFNKENDWGVNTYDREEWYETLKKVGFKIIVDANIHQHVPQLKGDELFYQHLFILDVNKK